MGWVQAQMSFAILESHAQTDASEDQGWNGDVDNGAWLSIIMQ